MLGCHRDHRHQRFFAFFVAAAALHKHCAAVAATGLNHGRDFLISPEFAQLLAQRALFHEVFAIEIATLSAGNFVVGDFGQAFFVVAAHLRRLMRLDLRISAEEHDRALELAAILVHVLIFFDLHGYGFGANGAICSRRPRHRDGDQRGNVRLRHARADKLLRPAAAKRAPAFQVRVLQPPRGELIARPFVGALHLRRAGQARANAVGQLAHDFHHVRIFEAFLPDARDHFVVKVFDGRRRGAVGGEHGRRQRHHPD